RTIQAQALALADGEPVGPLMAADDLAGQRVDDGTGLGTEPLGQKAARVAVGDEADVMAVGLVGHGQAAPGRLGPDLGLGGIAQREHGVGELLAGEHAQHVGLVLSAVDAAPQHSALQPSVVAGGDGVESERESAVEHRRELDLLVAAQTRVGGAARGVLLDEVLHHVAVEPLGHVPHVERDADHVGGPPRVPRVLDGAAAAGAGTVGLRVGRQCEVHAGDVVTGLGDASGGHSGIDAAGHGGKHAKTHDPFETTRPDGPPVLARGRREVGESRPMRLFGRKSGSAASAAGIREFWSWWDRTRSEIDALADAEETGRLAELIGPAVAAIHSSLEWEITPGRGGAARALVVTAAGDAELRPIAHRWAKAAPPADARWEFHPSRQADPDALEVTVDVGGYDFDLKELTFGLRVPPGTPRVNVTAYH